ncbi:homoserine acetyltransferase [Methylovirgula ligni]|uniref:Homoserine O-acetyltransferase n=1 Tax=Methylovirgula ligni TaxID=569860 RepID=A0A3D9Z202_9HYPH|nr:alpha/beta fold hydrolase [Methylovirgula ligni]QAY95477.1 homoserine acetyltransferase [Methylovirgula ligni]REF89192.1 homoserine O-acetyltransferase [Methylovirgula ligni]
MFVKTKVSTPRTAAGKPGKLQTLVLTTIAALGVMAQPAGAQTSETSTNAAAQPTASTQREADASFADYKFRDGETLQNLRLHYVTLGRPHKNASGSTDNAILLLHWTGANSRALLSPQYQTALFAPGAPLDPRRFFIIIPDDIGHGQSSKPSDGLKAQFPHYGYGDMVDLQHKLVVDILGISHLHAVIGMSMGCMNAWQWAEAYPKAMDGVMPIACFPAAISGRNLLWRRMFVLSVKYALSSGNFQHQPRPPAVPAALIRMMIDGVPHLQAEVTTPESADAFIEQAGKQSAGQDGNNAVYAFQSSEDFNAEPSLKKIKSKVYALNFADDEFYPDSLKILQRDVPKVARGRYVVRPTTAGSAGHFSMAFPTLWKRQVAEFIAWLDAR